MSRDERRSPYDRAWKRFAAWFIPNPDVGEPRLFPREALLWLGVAAIAVVFEANGNHPKLHHPTGLVGIPPAIFLLTLYMGLFRWAGAFVHLLWFVFPFACAALPFILARTHGGVVVPVLATAAAVAATVLSAEWLRRRSRAARSS